MLLTAKAELSAVAMGVEQDHNRCCASGCQAAAPTLAAEVVANPAKLQTQLGYKPS